MNEPLRFKNDSPEAKLAQQLLEEKFGEAYEEVRTGWTFGIDLATEETFVGESTVHVVQKAKSDERIVMLAMRVKGKDEWPWTIHRLDPRAYRLLEDFQAGECGAFTWARKNCEEFQPGMFRKVNKDLMAIVLSDSVEKLKPFVSAKHLGIEIRRITVTDVDKYLKTRHWVLEMVV